MDKVDKNNKSMAGRWPDPISFLKDYKKFGVNMRLVTIDAIVKQYSKESNKDNRYFLFYAATEQFYFALEMLLAFFHVSVDKAPIDLAKWIYPKPVNKKRYYNLSIMQNIVATIQYDDILKIYKEEFKDHKEQDIKKLTSPFKIILEYLKEKKEILGDNVAPNLFTIYNRCKHKFLAYRYKDGVSFLLPKEIELWWERVGRKINRKNEISNGPPNDIQWLVNLVKTCVKYTKIAINRTILRLKKPGANIWISGPGKNEKTISLP